MNQIQQEQEVIALRQLIEQTYANNSWVLEALRANADALDLELRSLPNGSSPSVAIDHLKSQQWFREAESAPFSDFAAVQPRESEWVRPSSQPVPGKMTPSGGVYDHQTVTQHFGTHQLPINRLLPWLDDSGLLRLANQGVADPSMWAQRYDPTCPSEFYRGYATLLFRIGDVFQSSASLAALGQLIDAFDLAIKALPADERRNGADFALMNVASYAQVGTVSQISATLAAEFTCIARCFVHNQARRL